MMNHQKVSDNNNYSDEKKIYCSLRRRRAAVPNRGNGNVLNDKCTSCCAA